MPDHDFEEFEKTEVAVAYYAAFGRFLNWFAMVETFIHLLHRTCTGLEDKVARQITEGMRISELTQQIHKLWKFEI